MILLGCLTTGCSNQHPQLTIARPEQTAPKPPVENPTDASLKRSVDQLLVVLDSGRPEAFPEFVSSDGLCLGVDCQSISVKQIKKEIQDKKGSYCQLFDSGCLHKQLSILWKKATQEQIREVLSFRDILNTAAGKEVDIQRNGTVHVRIRYKEATNNASAGFRPEEMDLGFVKEGSNWKVSGMSAY